MKTVSYRPACCRQANLFPLLALLWRIWDICKAGTLSACSRMEIWPTRSKSIIPKVNSISPIKMKMAYKLLIVRNYSGSFMAE